MNELFLRRVYGGLCLLTAGVVFLVFALNVWYAEPNQDEGWYLIAGKYAAEGQIPWRDFSFSQGPVMPYAYALAAPLTKAWGVLGGRIYTAAVGLMALVLAALLAWLLAPEKLRGPAALLALILGGINVTQACFFSIPKTYSVCAFWLTGGFVLLGFSVLRPSWRPWLRLTLCAAAGVFFALAGGSRMSALFAAAAPAAFLWLDRRHHGKSWLVFTISFASALCLIFLPFVILGGEAFRFWFYTYHVSRVVEGKLLFKAAFISQVAQAWLVPCALATVALLWYALDYSRQKSFRLPQPVPEKRARDFMGWVWASVGLVTLVHFASPFPYPDYQVFVVPLFVAALSALVLRLLADRLVKDSVLTFWLLAAVWLVAVAAAFSSPMNREWFQAGRDLIWWKGRHRSALADVRAAGAELRRMAPPGAVLFTQDAYLAVESGLRLPPGLEMGPFSYFPDLSREAAVRLHVVNKERMLEALRAGQVAAVSGYGFAISSPKIKPTSSDERKWWRDEIDKRYLRTATLTGFGQGQTTLELFIKRQ
jgi:hypothetical protein